MNIITTAPRGTADIYGDKMKKWRYVEKVCEKVAGLYGFSKVIFPTFEHTELFIRGVGETTDVVQKEMYTFEDKGNRSITLRPEGTASAVRLLLQNGLYAQAMPIKLYYLTNCFRYEKPQAGRQREFYQFGIELFGAAGAESDAFVISFADTLFKNLGITGVRLYINAIGCQECRPDYTKALREYFSDKNICETCKSRLDKNPMRILDCKCPSCQEISKDAPKITDYLCADCKEHYEKMKSNLENMQIEYEENPKIVRGLDYYTNTVFEFVTDKIGAQSTVLAGGRYDNLVESFGGDKLPGLGFGMGIERIILLMEALGLSFGEDEVCQLYIANLGENAKDEAAKLSLKLISEGIRCEYDICKRSFKAQMKYADKIGAKYTAVLGDNEIASKEIQLKNMATSETHKVSFDKIADFIKKFD